ncbi:MAG: putative porin [Paraglaciecola sp.]
MASSIASATLIVEVSDIQLTGGSNSFLTWSTTEFDDFSFGLDAASSQQYGTFSTNDSPIRLCEGFFCSGSDFNVDRISV